MSKTRAQVVLRHIGAKIMMLRRIASKDRRKHKCRLPTIDEWKQLFSAPAPDNLLHFNYTFWSSTEEGPSFNSLSIKTFRDYGIPYETKSDSEVKNAVRCVIELSLDDLKSQLKELDKEIKKLQEKHQPMDEEIEREISINEELEENIQKLKQENKQLKAIIKENQR